MWHISCGCVDAVGREAERLRLVVAGLRLALGEVDGAAVEPAGRAGLEASQLEAAGGEAVAERLGGAVAGPAAARLGLAGVHDRLEERAGRQDDGLGAIERVAAGQDAGDAAALAALSCGLDSNASTISWRSVRLACASTRCFIDELVELLVGLGARRVHGRALGAVEHAELDGRCVDDLAHLAAEGVDLADDLPLGDAADGRVAAHLGDGVGVHGEQHGAQAEPGRGEGGLDAGVAGADDDDVVIEGQSVHSKAREGSIIHLDDTAVRQATREGDKPKARLSPGLRSDSGLSARCRRSGRPKDTACVRRGGRPPLSRGRPNGDKVPAAPSRGQARVFTASGIASRLDGAAYTGQGMGRQVQAALILRTERRSLPRRISALRDNITASERPLESPCRTTEAPGASAA